VKITARTVVVLRKISSFYSWAVDLARQADTFPDAGCFKYYV
jgi:hypothetical protein